MRVCWLGVVVVAVSVFICAEGYAQEDDWAFEVTPYFWAIGMDGQVGVGGLPPTDVDMSFSDVWDNFEKGACLFTTARKDQWFALLDFTYMDLKSTETLPQTSATVDVDSYLIMLAGGRRLDLDLPFTVDAFAGARYKQFDNGLSIVGFGSASQDESWVDPLVGINLQCVLDNGLQLGMLADIGGFGVNSDMEWEIMPVVQYAFNDMFSAKVAYRWLDIDYEDSAFMFDVVTQGWLAGVGIKF